MRGQAAFVLDDRFRRCGGRRRQLGALLVPGDRVRLTHQRVGDDFVHAADRNDLQVLLDSLGDFRKVLGVLLRDQHGLHAAARGGMKTVLIPEENAKDLPEISEAIKKHLEIIPVSRMDEVIAHALVRKPEAITWDEESAKLAAAAATTAEPVIEDEGGLTAH